MQLVLVGVIVVLEFEVGHIEVQDDLFVVLHLGPQELQVLFSVKSIRVYCVGGLVL